MDTEKTKAQFAIWCVRQVEHLLPEKSKQALNVVEKFCNGDASSIDVANAKVIAWESIQDAIYAMDESAKDAAWAAYYAVCFETEKAAKNAAAAIAYAAAPQPWNPKHIHAKQAALAAQEEKRFDMFLEEETAQLKIKQEYFLHLATGNIEGDPEVIQVVKNNDELLTDLLQFLINEAESNNNAAFDLRERMAQTYAAMESY